MNKLVLLLGASAICLASQELKLSDQNVYVTNTSSLFASDVSSFNQMNFGNSRAVYIEPDGHKGEWQTLRKGRGKTKHISHYGVFEGAEDVILGWSRQVDFEHVVVDYGWIWTGGSSSQSDVVQVFELRDGKVFITQQIEADTHGGGTAAGATFDQKTKQLIVKSVELDSPRGRCCPTHLNIVVFRWEQGKFRPFSSRQVPMPKDKYQMQN